MPIKPSGEGPGPEDDEHNAKPHEQLATNA